MINTELSNGNHTVLLRKKILQQFNVLQSGGTYSQRQFLHKVANTHELPNS